MKLTKINRARHDRRGTAVAEYGLIAAVAGVAIAVATLAFGSAVSDGISASATCIEVRC